MQKKILERKLRRKQMSFFGPEYAKKATAKALVKKGEDLKRPERKNLSS